MVLDLKDPAGRDALLELLADADVFLANWRAGIAESLGLTDDVLAATNPRLVRCFITGFGPGGPLAAEPAFDTVLQARSGLTDAITAPGHDPSLIPGYPVDKQVGMMAVQAILASLFERAQTGTGDRIEVPMLDVATYLNFSDLFTNRVFVDHQPDVARNLQMTAIRPVRALDGWIVCAAVTSPQIAATFDAPSGTRTGPTTCSRTRTSTRSRRRCTTPSSGRPRSSPSSRRSRASASPTFPPPSASRWTTTSTTTRCSTRSSTASKSGPTSAASAPCAIPRPSAPGATSPPTAPRPSSASTTTTVPGTISVAFPPRGGCSREHGCPRFGSMLEDAEARTLSWGDPLVTGSWSPGSFALPAGTVTFLLTDVESSTKMWELESAAMADAISRHYELLDAAITSHDGVRPLEQGEGDSVVAAFSRASDAVLAALDAQRALFEEPWPTATPLKVRMAVHTGEARLRDDRNYAGQAVIRTARLRAIAHGGQVVISSAARDLVIDHLGDDVTLVDLGVHRLKDLARPEHVWQLAHADLTAEFPPLRSLDAVPNNLPVTLSSFIGRFDDIVTVVGLLDDNRLITLTGSGGAGKTRLAQQVAAEVAERYPDGVWWVDLVGLTNAALVPSAISRATMVPEDPGDPLVGIAERLSEKCMLLVLDNCEHLLDGCADVAAALLASCSDVTVLATSRAPLNVPGELSWRVPPLAIPVRGAATRTGRGALAIRRGSPLRRPCDQRPAELPPARRQRGHRGRDLRTARRDTTGHRARGGALSRPHAGADPRRARQHDRDARRRTAGGAAAPPDD